VAVTDSSAAASSLDGAIVAFLLRVVDQFETLVSDPDKLLAALRGVGLDDPGVDQLQSFLSAQAANVSKLSADLPKLLAVLESSDPDYASLIGPVTDLWSVVSGLVESAPKLDPSHLKLAPSLPNGDVIGQLVTVAVDRALREGSTALWSALAATGFVGPGMSILTAVSDAIAHPFSYVWKLYQELRRESTLSVAGILTGPRVVSMSSVELGQKSPPSPAITTAFGVDAIVLQRLVLKLAADTYDTPVKLMLEFVGTADLPPKFTAAVLTIDAVAAPISIGTALQLAVTPANLEAVIAMTSFGAVKVISDTPPTLTLAAQTPRTFMVGSDGGIHLSLQQPVFEVSVSPTSWDARFGVTGFELAIPQSAVGPLLGIFLPSNGVSLKGKLLFRLDSDGLHFDGGIGFSMSWPDVVHLPGVVLHSLVTALDIQGAKFPISATGTVVVELGPLTITIEGFGVSLPLALTTDGSGNLGILDLQPPSFATPTGIGVEIDAGVVKGGGYLRIGNGQIAGALELALVLGPLELSIQAFGIIEEVNGELSFIVIMSIEFAPPIEIFLGLTLNAVGGVFGLNRTLDTPSLRGLVRDGRAKDVLIPDDLVARADEILAAVAAVFPAKSDQYVVGPILELGWGRPVSIVRMTAGIVFTFPDPVVVVIIGEFQISVPDPEVPIIYLQADFAGIINLSTGDVSFDASLAKSRIGMFDVAGDIALRAGSESFVFTAGGFNPLFAPPADLASIRRLSISLSPSPILSIWAEAYFAITASSLQFGAGIYMEASLGPIGAKGHLSLDALIRTEPKLYFSISISGEFQLTVGGDDICSISIDVLLEGPGLWHAHAHASIDILFFSISGTIDLSWGTDSTPELGPPVNVADKVHGALGADTAWAHVLPAADGGTVQLRAGADALHPLGVLRLTQTAAPLDVSLAKFGANAVTSADPVTVVITATGGVVAPAQELFATSQFFQLSDEDRLSKPAFLPFDAGGVLQGSAWQVNDAVTGTVIYEESLGKDSNGVVLLHKFRTLDSVALGWASLGAAGRAHPSTSARVLPAKIAVSPPSWSVADAATGAIVGTGAASAVIASTRISADRVAVADFELRAFA
jgi:hypothetical protein